jgi:alkyl sulfatase BDS1-like metallo-beta-lactamase superfamily hydrolase
VEVNMSIKRRAFLKGCAGAAAALGFSRGAIAPADAAEPAQAPSAVRRTAAGRFSPAQSAPILGKDAQPLTKQLHKTVLNHLPFDADRQDYADALRGMIAPLPPEAQKIASPIPQRPPIWDLSKYDFLKGGDTNPPSETTVWAPAPPEANPSLWRQGQVNLIHGLFEVAPGMYQVRGADMTNLTIVEGKKGILLIDPMVSCETAAAALKVYRDHRDPGAARPVTALIYTHSHSDHYGGVRGVLDEADVKAGRVAIIAPDRFLEKVISENVLAGTAMTRRANYSYGFYLPRGPLGQIDAGLGKAVSIGTVSLIPPTDTIVKTGERRKIDGIDIVFQMTPDTEAPAEMMMHFPQFRVLDAAELACSLLHNIYTPRGAEVRDATMWAHYLDEAIDLFGEKSDVVITSHNWPTWGRDAVVDYLARQRDLYKYLHDQTLHLANQGLTMTEIAEELARNRQLPAGLEQQWYARGYYGALSHNVKAVYNKYLGYYDSNPAHLEPLPPEPAARRYVEFMGGADAVIQRAQTLYDNPESVDDYRWVAEVMSHVVFADPTNVAARNLGADALEQLGYQSESAIWRNQYLSAAYELRNGNPVQGGSGTANADTINAMPIGSYFDYLGVRLNAERAEGISTVLNWLFTDTREKYALTLSNSALTYRAGRVSQEAHATLKLTRATLNTINLAPNAQYPQMTPEQAFDAAIASGAIQVAGDAQKARQLLGDGGLLDTFTTRFNIVEP